MFFLCRLSMRLSSKFISVYLFFPLPGKHHAAFLVLQTHKNRQRRLLYLHRPFLSSILWGFPVHFPFQKQEKCALHQAVRFPIANLPARRIWGTAAAAAKILTASPKRKGITQETNAVHKGVPIITINQMVPKI